MFPALRLVLHIYESWFKQSGKNSDKSEIDCFKAHKLKPKNVSDITLVGTLWTTYQSIDSDVMVNSLISIAPQFQAEARLEHKSNVGLGDGQA